MSNDFRDGFYGRLAAKNGIERDKYKAEIKRQKAIFLAANAEIQLLSETLVQKQAEIERLNKKCSSLYKEGAETAVIAGQEIERLKDVLRQTANILHHGGLMGFKDEMAWRAALNKLTLPYWDKDECTKLQIARGA